MRQVKATLVSSAKIEVADKPIKVSLYGPDNYKAAVVSHYNYSRNPKLKKPALEYAKEALDGYVSEPELESALQLHFGLEDVPFPKPKNPKFTFIDLFAGIGGFR